MPKFIKPNINRIRRDIESLAEITDRKTCGYTRVSFTREDRRAREFVRQLMEAETDLKVYVDAAGNMIGRCEGKQKMPSIMVGSHLDTVSGGGRFDGIAGVVAGLEVARKLKEDNIVLQHPLEVVIFLAEEPSCFGISTIGSRAIAGKLNKSDLLLISNANGKSLYDGIRDMGGDPDHIHLARRNQGDILLNLELHIEQGPVLYSETVDIGLVTGIAGIFRGKVEISGQADHSGTTPMDKRKDALASSAEIILALERICKQIGNLVGTIGTIEIFPNVSNVVPSNAVLGMEIRFIEQPKLDLAVSLFKETLTKIKVKRRLEKIKTDIWQSSPLVYFDQQIIDKLAGVCEVSGIPYLKIMSGAGHDATHISEIAPTGMIFIPSKDGKSHCPEEWSDYAHIALGVEVLANTIISTDNEY